MLPQATLKDVGDRPFEFSKVYIFGKFDSFCSRLTMLTNLFDSIQVYSRLFNSRIEGQALQSLMSLKSLTVSAFDKWDGLVFL